MDGSDIYFKQLYVSVLNAKVLKDVFMYNAMSA